MRKPLLLITAIGVAVILIIVFLSAGKNGNQPATENLPVIPNATDLNNVDSELDNTDLDEFDKELNQLDTEISTF